MNPLDKFARDVASAICLEDGGPCAQCWAIADDVIPIGMEFAGLCKHCAHRIPDHDAYGRCCATVECNCHREGDE